MTGAGGGDPFAVSDVLAGSRWVIEEIGGVAIAGATVIIQFGHDGRVWGNTGVNDFTGSYEVAGQFIMFGPVAATRRAGSPDATAQEQRIFGSFAGGCRFAVDSRELVFEGPRGTVRCWNPDAAPAEPRPAPRPSPDDTMAAPRPPAPPRPPARRPPGPRPRPEPQ